MKKGKILALALIGLMLAGGLALASCRAGCEGAGTCKIEGSKGSACTNQKCAVFKKATGTRECDC